MKNYKYTHRSYLLMLFMLINLAAIAQAPACLWAKKLGANSNVTATSMHADGSGNVYVTGYFSGKTAVLGNETLVNSDTGGLTSDIFVVKLNTAGDIVWATGAGGIYNDQSLQITNDGNGNVYITGSSSSPVIIFGTDTVTNISVAGNPFIAKYSSAGAIDWVKSTNDSVTFNNVHTDAGNNIYVTGGFYCKSITFGSYTFTNTGVLTDDAFIVKFDTSGNTLWASSLGGSGNDELLSLSSDADGNIYVGGSSTSPTLNIGDTTLGDWQVGSNYPSIFVARYNTSGNVTWAKNLLGAVPGNISGLSTDNAGNTYVTGSYVDSQFVLFQNFFISKFDPSGTLLWLKTAAAPAGIYANGVSVNNNGNILVSGSFSSDTLLIGNDTLINTLSGDGNENIFIARYDTLGNVTWAASFGGPGYDGSAGIATDNNGNAYTAGFFTTPDIIFGTDTLVGGNGINNNFVYNTYVTKFGTATTGITNTFGTPNTITVYPNPSSGQFYFKGITAGSTLEVYDVLGQNVFSTTITPSGGGMGEDTYLLNISSQAKGIYFYRVVSNGNALQDGKMVVE